MNNLSSNVFQNMLSNLQTSTCSSRRQIFSKSKENIWRKVPHVNSLNNVSIFFLNMSSDLQTTLPNIRNGEARRWVWMSHCKKKTRMARKFNLNLTVSSCRTQNVTHLEDACAVYHRKLKRIQQFHCTGWTRGKIAYLISSLKEKSVSITYEASVIFFLFF
jgi:hypothetical protein